MNTKSFKWKRRILVLLVGVGVVVGLVVFLKGYATPTIRTDVAVPLFTVGDANYETALAEGKNIVKFGRLPFGFYSGGVAFDDAAEAREYIESIGKVEQGWKVYLLSGDFEQDTDLVNNSRFTNKSLLVLEPVDAIDPRVIGDYEAFDQKPNSGWRLLADDGQYEEAAILIVSYLAAHEELDAAQERALHFHAGKMYAYANNYEKAKTSFASSLMEVEPVESPIRRNAYVKATIAFLNNDKNRLNTFREEIAAGPKLGNVTPNLDVVDTLIAHLGEPYSKAYESHRGMQSR